MSPSSDTAMPKPPTRRGPGRPRKAQSRTGADAPDLRERLLDVAIECFAHHGIATATLREIAGEAGVNPALVHYYFGDKAQLQQAVIVERLMPAFDEVRKAVMESGDDIHALIAGFVRGM